MDECGGFNSYDSERSSQHGQGHQSAVWTSACDVRGEAVAFSQVCISWRQQRTVIQTKPFLDVASTALLAPNGFVTATLYGLCTLDRSPRHLSVSGLGSLQRKSFFDLENHSISTLARLSPSSRGQIERLNWMLQ